MLGEMGPVGQLLGTEMTMGLPPAFTGPSPLHQASKEQGGIVQREGVCTRRAGSRKQEMPWLKPNDICHTKKACGCSH